MTARRSNRRAATTQPTERRPAPASVARVYRFELVKLRLAVADPAACSWPAGRVRALFVAAVSRQGTLPTDTLFGRWMHATGWAGPLVVLGFAGTWALPLLTSVVAGDVFAAEDRLGTWRHLLVAVRSPRRIFAAKAPGEPRRHRARWSAARRLEPRRAAWGGRRPAAGRPRRATAGAGAAAAAGRAARLGVRAGADPGLRRRRAAGLGRARALADGAAAAGAARPRDAARAAAAAAGRRAPGAAELRVPRLERTVHRARPDRPAAHRRRASAWSGRWPRPRCAYLLFIRRDFTDLAYDGAGAARCSPWRVLPLAALVAVAVAPGRGGDRGARLRASTRRKARARRSPRPSPTSTGCRPTSCTAPPSPRRSCATAPPATRAAAGSPTTGPATTGAASSPGTSRARPPPGSAIYQLDVAAERRYVADGDGPKEVNGYFTVHTPTGDAPNPLWQFDGNVDLL